MSNQDLRYTLSLQDLFTGKMNAALKQTQRMDGMMSKLKNSITTLGVGFGIREIVNIGSEFERAEIQLKTLLKSSSEAKRVFKDLQKESEVSPFGFDTLLKGNAALISTGLSADKAKEDFNALANAIAATGGGEDALQRMVFNLQQIKNVGATAADIKQFGMAGINIYGLLDTYAKKYNVTIDKHHITYEQITEALKLAGKEGGQYFGALDNLANSTSGKLSNLYDAFKNLAYDIYNTLRPAITIVVKGLTALFNLIKNFLPLIKTLIILWGSYYLKLKLATWQTTQFALAQRAMAMGMSKSAVAAGFLKRGIQGIGQAIKAVPILGWILAIADGIQYLWDKFSWFREFLYGTVEIMRNIGSILADTFRGIGMMLSGAITMNTKKMQEGYDLVMQGQAKTLKAAMVGVLKGKKSFASDSLDGGIAGAVGAGGSIDELGAKGGSGKGLGSGTEVSGARPQSINITINKLVETLEIKTQNISEGYGKVKEQVAQALLESVNDLNMIAR